MKRTLNLAVVVEPDPEAPRLLDEAMDLLANAIADRLIARAREAATGAPATPSRELPFDSHDLEDLDA